MKKIYIIKSTMFGTMVARQDHYSTYTNDIKTARLFAGREHAESYIRNKARKGYYTIETIYKK